MIREVEELLEELARFQLHTERRRGRCGRYWMRRRAPARMLERAGVGRAELGKRGGGLFRVIRARVHQRLGIRHGGVRE